jgi:hypothetical protein
MPGEPVNGLVAGPGRLLHPARLKRCPRRPRHDPRTLGVIARAQRKGLPVIRICPRHVQGERSVAGHHQEAASPVLEHSESLLLLVGRLGQGDGLAVVVGDDLGTSGQPLSGQVLQPLSSRLVAAYPPLSEESGHRRRP